MFGNSPLGAPEDKKLSRRWQFNMALYFLAAGFYDFIIIREMLEAIVLYRSMPPNKTCMDCVGVAADWGEI